MNTKKWYESTGADLLPAAIAKLRADADEAEAYLQQPSVTITLPGPLAGKLLNTMHRNILIPQALEQAGYDYAASALSGPQMDVVAFLLDAAGARY